MKSALVMGLISRIMGYGKDELISMARDVPLYDAVQFVSIHEGLLRGMPWFQHRGVCVACPFTVY